MLTLACRSPVPLCMFVWVALGLGGHRQGYLPFTGHSGRPWTHARHCEYLSALLAEWVGHSFKVDRMESSRKSASPTVRCVGSSGPGETADSSSVSGGKMGFCFLPPLGDVGVVIPGPHFGQPRSGSHQSVLDPPAISQCLFSTVSLTRHKSVSEFQDPSNTGVFFCCCSSSFPVCLLLPLG